MGYSDENLFIKIDPEEEHEQFPARLYHHTASQEDLSEKILFEEGSFNFVLNVKSSHCYGSIPLFLTEVKRVLKPGGFFLWSNFGLTKEMSTLFSSFLGSSLIKIREKNITCFVLNALKKMSQERTRKIKKRVPKPIQPVFMSFTEIEGSEVYDSFIQNKLTYKSVTFKKPK